MDAEVTDTRQLRRPSLDSGTERVGLRTVTRVSYAYAAPGSAERHHHTEILSRGRRATPGQTLRVFVDPDNPRRSSHEIAAPGTTGCLGIPMLVLGVALLAAGILLCLAWPTVDAGLL